MAVTVASVGDNCVDHYVGPPERALPGGNALNVAVHLAGAGLDARYLGIVGDDADGRLLVSAGHAAGVDVGQVEVRGGGRTGVTVVRHDGAEREFVSEDYGVAAEVALDAATLAKLADVGWVHATRVGEAGVGLATLVAAGKRTSYDLGEEPSAELVAEVAPHLDVAFVSAPAADAAAVAEAILAAGARTVVVTQGARGALVAHGSAVVVLDAPPVEVVDTLGAGDALIGAYIAATIAGAAPGEALATAMAAAAQACTHVGAWSAPFPEREAS